jgi:transposase-like protein
MEILETKHRFIELRAKGYSFDKIALELNKAKQTLIDWSRELKEEIEIRKATELELIYESYFLLKKSRLQSLGDILLRIETEIGQRSLSTIPTDKLLDIYLKYSNQIKAELEPVNENKERDPITIIFTKN